MAVCLDSSFLVDLLAGEAGAVTFTKALTEPVAISAVTFYELLVGVRERRLLKQVEALAGEYSIVPADFDVCAMAATIQSRLSDEGRMIPALDALIAATAVLAGIPLVSRDEHFSWIPRDFNLTVVGY